VLDVCSQLLVVCLEADTSHVLQMKDFMTLYSGLVERCFMDCAQDMTTTKLKAGEESCVNHCADKFLALSTRCAVSFCYKCLSDTDDDR
jgi:hypothetical protein